MEEEKVYWICRDCSKESRLMSPKRTPKSWTDHPEWGLICNNCFIARGGKPCKKKTSCGEKSLKKESKTPSVISTKEKSAKQIDGSLKETSSSANSSLVCSIKESQLSSSTIGCTTPGNHDETHNRLQQLEDSNQEKQTQCSDAIPDTEIQSSI